MQSLPAGLGVQPPHLALERAATVVQRLLRAAKKTVLRIVCAKTALGIKKAVGVFRRPSCFCQRGFHQSSEDQSGGELEVARAAAAEEGVADAYVGRDVDGQEAYAAARQGVYAVEGGVRREAGQKGRGEVRVVEEVENLCAQLERD